MRKLSRSAYEDTKGLVRAAETLLEVVVMTLLYYGAFRKGYEIEHFVSVSYTHLTLPTTPYV